MPYKSKISNSPKTVTDIQPLVTLPELDLFQHENIQVSVQSVIEEEILPTGTWDTKSEISFNLKGDPETFLDPNSLRLTLKVSVVNADGGKMGLETVAPITNFGCSLFEKVGVRIGHSTQISGQDNLYPYLSYFINVFKNSELFQKQINYPFFLYKDTELYFDEYDTTKNIGFKQRWTASKQSNILYLEVPIYSPITTQTKLLPPGINLFIQLSPANDPFLIMSGVALPQRTQKIKIASVSLRYKKVRLNAGLHLNLMEALRLGPAIYPCKYYQMLEFSRVPGTQVIMETLFTGRTLPSYVHLFILGTDRRLGNYSLSPWYVGIDNLTDVKLVSGTESYPSMGYKLDIPDVNAVPAYLAMLKAVGSLDNKNGRSNGLTFDDFLHGYGLLSFDLTRTSYSGDVPVTDIPRTSDLQIHMSFKNPMPVTTSFILILERNSTIYIRDNSDVSTDFVL